MDSWTDRDLPPLVLALAVTRGLLWVVCNDTTFLKPDLQSELIIRKKNNEKVD